MKLNRRAYRQIKRQIWQLKVTSGFFLIVAMGIGPLLNLLFPDVWAAAPSRTQSYVSGQVISPTAVTENEDNIYAYLQAGVDTLRNNSVTTAAIAAGAVENSDLASNAVTTDKITDATVATADLANNAVTGAKIALGSDAQGDVLYYDGTDWARLGAGTSGQFLQTQGAGANPTWASSSASVKTGSFTRDLTAASGSVAYTGIGFQPKAVLFICAVGGVTGSTSVGVDDASTAGALHDDHLIVADTFGIDTTNQSISFQQGVGTSHIGKVSAFGADGFTIAYTKTGSPTGTGTCMYWAIR